MPFHRQTNRAPSSRRRLVFDHRVLERLFNPKCEAEERHARKNLKYARVSDLIWLGLEMSDQHNQIWAMIHQRQASQEVPVAQTKPMDITAATEISEGPLRTWLSSQGRH
jgi:hypothetical protein